MRVLLIACVLMPCAWPALAETIETASHITHVTIYPEGAEVTRVVEFDAPVGSHDLLITDLPAATESSLLRIAPQGGLQTGAYALRHDRLPPREDILTAAQIAAKAALATATASLRDATAAADTIRARIEAAEAQVAFLRGMGGPLPDAANPDTLQALSRMIGAEVLAARQSAITAQVDLWPATEAVTDAENAVTAAQAAYDALSSADTDYAALSVAITAPIAGKAVLRVTHFIADASWRPVYDLKLTRAGTPSLAIARGVLVSQSSGEDWAGVDLTLSTAQPSEQAEPSRLWPELRRIAEPQDEMAKRVGAMAGADMEGGIAEPVMEPEVVEAATMLEGDVVVYHYPRAVDVAGGVEELRLALDEITLAPEIQARAVPRMDATAYLMAHFTNTSGEILLPGNAYLMRDGVLVGGTWLEKIAPGDEADLAFGPIETLRLTRDMPTRAEGDRGILTKSTQIEETAVLKVENLGTESWPVRLMDLVPYSEQEDLEVTFTADPAPVEADVDGQRGILAWEFTLAAGEAREVRLDTVIRWPEGMELQSAY